MRIKQFLTAAIVTMSIVSASWAADIRFIAEEKQITPTTGGFTLSFTAINDTAAALPVANITVKMLFDPEVNGNLNFVNASFPATPSWVQGPPNPGNDSLLDDKLNISASTGSSAYMLAVGATTFMVVNLELDQPTPDLAKYAVNFDLIEIGDLDGNVYDVLGVSGSIAVPEPGSVMAIGSLAGLLLMRRRRTA